MTRFAAGAVALLDAAGEERVALHYYTVPVSVAGWRTPMAMMRSAPRLIAGLRGAVLRMLPSPK